jgi:hypothetical protein
LLRVLGFVQNRGVSAIKTLLLSLLLIATVRAAEPDKPTLASTLSDHSPDGKCAMRIVHEAGDETLRSESIRRIEIVALASGKAVAQLLPEDDVGTHFQDWRLLWSPDSKWCAFYYESPRTGYTTVYRRANGKFAATHKPYTLTSPEPDAAREYAKPVRWTNDGKLILYQWTLSGPGEGGRTESHMELTAAYDKKKGRFRIIKTRELSQEEEEKLEKETTNE